MSADIILVNFRARTYHKPVVPPEIAQTIYEASLGGPLPEMIPFGGAGIDGMSHLLGTEPEAS